MFEVAHDQRFKRMPEFRGVFVVSRIEELIEHLIFEDIVIGAANELVAAGFLVTRGFTAFEKRKADHSYMIRASFDFG